MKNTLTVLSEEPLNSKSADIHRHHTGPCQKKEEKTIILKNMIMKYFHNTVMCFVFYFNTF